MSDCDVRYVASKHELKAAQERVEHLCRYAVVLAEMLHPGFLKQLSDASNHYLVAESEAIQAAVQASSF